jgi:hypothetical protein
MLWSGRIIMTLIILVAVGGLATTIADMTLRLGWGYGWSDILGCLGIIAGTGVLWLINELVFRPNDRGY